MSHRFDHFLAQKRPEDHSPLRPALPEPRDVGVQRWRELALILPDVDLREVIFRALPY